MAEEEILIATPLLLTNRVIEQNYLNDRNELLRKYRDEIYQKNKIRSNEAATLAAPSSLSLSSMLIMAISSSSSCSFASTSYKHSIQLWRNCYTCSLIDSNGCCLICSSVCHAGHQLGELRLSQFFCDCGAAGTKQCQAMHERQNVSDNLENEEISNFNISSSHPAAIIDFSSLSKSLLNSSRRLFHNETRQSLRMRERLLTLQLLSKQQREYYRARSNNKLLTNADSGSAVNDGELSMQRNESFSLSTLISMIDFIDNDNNSSSSSSSVILTAIAAFLTKQKPLSLNLSLTEQRHYERIIKQLKLAYLNQPSNLSLLQSLIHAWLSVGGVKQILETVTFLIEENEKISKSSSSSNISSLPIPVIEVISNFLSKSRQMENRILFTQRKSMMTEISIIGKLCKIELLCESLSSEYNSIPSTIAASTLTGKQNNIITITSRTGILPSIALSSDGSFLYALLYNYGLVKIGTGNVRSIPGELKLQRVEFSIHAGGQITCIKDENGRDILLLRSPLIQANILWRINTENFDVIGRELLTEIIDKRSISAPFDIEFDSGVTQTKSPSDQWQQFSTLLSTLTNLPPHSLELMKSQIAETDWRLDEEREIVPFHRLTLTSAGLFLIVESKHAVVKYRLRLKWKNRPMPIINVRSDNQHSQSATMMTFDVSDERVTLKIFERRNDGENFRQPWKLIQSQPMTDYQHELPHFPPSTSQTTNVVKSSSALSPSLPSPLLCSGCGLLSWSDEKCFVCLDGCSGLCLCNLCQKQKRFQSEKHSTQHEMDQRKPTMNAKQINNKENEKSLLIKDISTGSLYCDERRIILFPSVLPPSTVRHWREFCVGDIVDVRDIYQKW